MIFLRVTIPACLFVTLSGVLELYLGVRRPASGVAHFAHLGGLLGGFLMFLQRRGLGPWRRR
jgi:membrane associated rhomboid family serine protease